MRKWMLRFPVSSPPSPSRVEPGRKMKTETKMKSYRM
jgi:hypothetical protein